MYTFPHHITPMTFCSWLRARVQGTSPEAVAASLQETRLEDPQPLAQGLELFAQTASGFAVGWMMELLAELSSDSELWREVVSLGLDGHLGRMGELTPGTMRRTLGMWTSLTTGRGALFEALSSRLAAEEEDGLRAALLDACAHMAPGPVALRALCQERAKVETGPLSQWVLALISAHVNPGEISGELVGALVEAWCAPQGLRGLPDVTPEQVKVQSEQALLLVHARLERRHWRSLTSTLEGLGAWEGLERLGGLMRLLPPGGDSPGHREVAHTLLEREHLWTYPINLGILLGMNAMPETREGLQALV